MNTLNQNELTNVCGGIDPLNDPFPLQDNRNLQWSLDQLAREQEAAFLRGMIMECAD
jgi:hypothetical protein